MPFGNVLPLGVLAFGLLFVVLGVSGIFRDRRRRESWRRCPGRVVASRLDDGQTRSQIAFTLDGREHVFWNRVTSTTITDPVGREVEVLVNPEDPDDAVVGGGLVGGGVTGIALLGVGVLAVIVGGFLLA